jgi:large subunit ribosomal protein L5
MTVQTQISKTGLGAKYEREIRPALQESLGLSSVMAVPALEKVVINMGVGQAVQNPKIIDQVVEDLALIAGQKPVVRKARKSIANFKLREGMPIGASVTLRQARMYEFLERLIRVALPRVRDFRGLNPKGFDGRGNYTLGVREHTIFSEINLDNIENVVGLSVTLVTSAPTDEQGRALLLALGLPLRTS